MYLCVCNAVSEGQVRDAIERGADSFTAITRVTGLSQQCGQCSMKAKYYCDGLLGAARLAENNK